MARYSHAGDHEYQGKRQPQIHFVGNKQAGQEEE